MPAMLESFDGPLSLKQAARISPQLAEDLSRLTLRTEGFSVEDYLSLDGPYLIEYVDGRIQVLPMPDRLHQELLLLILLALREWTAANDPEADVVFAPFFVHLSEVKYREPDVSLLLGRNRHRRSRKQWQGADFVVEVVSESNRDHDLVTKRREYAEHGFAEYWIVDPAARSITVLTLGEGGYIEHGVFGVGDVASGTLLDRFTLDVGDLFARAEQKAG
jgi:Uma2 family endonuclease